MSRVDLPPPDADARAVSRRLEQRILARIDAEGPLSLAEYWDEVLYAPGLGYYAAGAEKFGPRGDFITAPELGDVFARCLATPVAETLSALGGGQVLELGPGSGRLAADLLAALDSADALPERYALLEVSASLRQRQQDLLAERVPELLDRVCWLDRPPEQAYRGFILANEVVDALPARRYRRDADGWREQRVGRIDGDLGWQEAPVDPADAKVLSALEGERSESLPEGYLLEYQPALTAWAAAVTANLTAGRVLIVDYGYPRHEFYHPERRQGTLLCHYRHRAHDDPFWWPGLNDLSVNVEFTALAEALDAAGLTVDGFNSQAQFLIGCGLGSVVGESTEAITAERVNLVREVQMLTRPGAMGERFQVLTAARGVDGPASGFQHHNRLDRL